MYKPRYYFWIGLGTGLIIGALLLQMMIQAREQIHLDDITVVEKAADKLGYRLVPLDEVTHIGESNQDSANANMKE